MTRITLAAALAWMCLVCAALWTRPAGALPRFAIREGVQCQTCHVNPSGGGMRNQYGRYVFETTRLTAGFPWSARSHDLVDFGIGDALDFGADLRSAYIDQTPKTGDATRTFFLMQGDLYVSARLFEGLTLYYDRGVYGSFEAFGLYQRDLGASSSFYLKLGRFMPTYGLRLENHNLFVRQDIGFGPTDKDTGIEVGLYAGPLLLQAGVLNGVGPERQFDDNVGKGITGKAEVLGRLGDLHLLAGASIYRNVAGDVTDAGGIAVDTRTTQLKAGVHWGAALGRFAYLGEADLIRIDPSAGNSDASRERSLRTYQELDALIVRGIDVTFNYETREPDLELASGIAHRFAAGFELFPVPFSELKLLYRQSIGTGPAEDAQDGLKELIAMLHLFF